MEMSGKESYALMKLEDTVTKAQSKGKPHEAYEFEMLLVETLIYQVLSFSSLNDSLILICSSYFSFHFVLKKKYLFLFFLIVLCLTFHVTYVFKTITLKNVLTYSIH